MEVLLTIAGIITKAKKLFASSNGTTTWKLLHPVGKQTSELRLQENTGN
jgi:hypothetical protein